MLQSNSAVLRVLGVAFVVLLAPVGAAGQQFGEPYAVDPEPAAEEGEGTPPADEGAPEEEVPPEGDGDAAAAAVAPTSRGRPPAHYRELWGERRAARKGEDLPAAKRLLGEIIVSKQHAGWPDFFVMGEALAREAEAASTNGRTTEALRLSDAAIELAPHSPKVHLASASVRWDAGELMNSAAAWYGALNLSWSDPALRRLRGGNISLGAWVALLLASGAFLVVMLNRYLASYARAMSRRMPTISIWNAWFVVAVLFLLPVLLRPGAAVVFVSWCFLLSLRYRWAERAIAVLVVAIAAATPFLLPSLTSHLGYAGSRSQLIYAAAQAMEGEGAATLLIERNPQGIEEMFVKGLRAQWSGEPQEAKRWLQDAIEAGATAPELYTTLGNVQFSLGSSLDAIESYKQAIALDPEHVVAHFNLSRVHYAQAEHQKAGVAHRNATAIDFERVERYTQQAKRAGPGFVVPEEVPDYLLRVPIEPNDAHEVAVQQIWRWLGGDLDAELFAAACGGIALVVLLLGFVTKPEDLAGATPEALSPDADEQLKIHAEIAAHRRKARATRVRWLLSILIAGGGQVHRGATLRGVLGMALFMVCVVLAFLGYGFIPEAIPSDSAYLALMAGISTFMGLLIYGLTLWDAVREEA